MKIVGVGEDEGEERQKDDLSRVDCATQLWVLRSREDSQSGER